MPRLTRLLLAGALMVWASLAQAQANLGQLLDGGGKRLSINEFKEEIVGRTLVGPTPAGGKLELMYVPNGSIAGVGAWDYNQTNVTSTSQINGDWRTDENGRICTTMLIRTGMAGTTITVPSRCQFWFKLGDQYFYSDSDYDRATRVVKRTFKP